MFASVTNPTVIHLCQSTHIISEYGLFISVSFQCNFTLYAHIFLLCNYFSPTYIEKVKVKSLSCVWLFATPWTVAYQAPLSMGFFPGKNTGVGCHFLLHKIFPTQRLNLGLPCCRQTLYCLSHQENRKAVAILLRNQTGFESDFTTEIISLRLIFALET